MCAYNGNSLNNPTLGSLMNFIKSIICSVMTALSIIPWQSHAADVWQADKSYTGGSEVCYANTLYKAKWWANPGEAPGATQWGAWAVQLDSTPCYTSVEHPQSPR